MPYHDDLQRELVQLRHGRGLQGARLASRLGPLLRELTGVLPSDQDRVVRHRVAQVLGELAADLPDDLRAAAELALGFGNHPLAGRLTWRAQAYAKASHCSERTARRRMDDAIQLIAQAATAPEARATVPGTGWWVRSFSALLRLDTPTPELFETRTVVAERQLAEVVVELDLPPRPADAGPALPLTIDVLYGARIGRIDRDRDHRHYRVTVLLPHALDAGASLEFCLHYRVPPDQQIRDHYALVPLDRFDHARVRVRFAPGRPPAAVWRLTGVAPRQLDRATATPDAEQLEPDGAGEVGVVFHGLRPGHGYGLAWAPQGPAA